jgi:hypothetical protein
MTTPVSVALAALYWALAGLVLLLAAGIGTSSLQPDLEEPRLPLAFLAGVLLLVGAGLVGVAARPATGHSNPDPRQPKTRPALAIVATIGLLLAAYFFVAAAPGGLPFDDSWAEGIAATSGLWVGLTALALIDPRVCRRVAALGCIALILGSLAVTLSNG